MKKLVSILLTITTIALLLAGCSSSNSGSNSSGSNNASSAPAESKAAEKKAPIKVVLGGHVKQGSPEIDALFYAKEQLEKRGNGAFVCEVFADGTLGGEVELGEQVKSGAVHIGTSGFAVLDKYARKYVPWSVPYLFPNQEAVTKSFNGKTGDAIKKAYADNGIIFWGLMYRGNRQLTTNKMVTTPDDIKGLKLRLPETEAWMTVWKELGTLPVPIASPELFGALQQGVVEAQENPITSNYNKNLWEVQKYTIMTNHIVDFLPLIVNKKWYDGLDEENKKLVKTVLDEAVAEAVKISQEKESKYRKEMEEKGMEFVDIDTTPFREKSAPALEIISKDWEDWVYEEAMKDAGAK